MQNIIGKFAVDLLKDRLEPHGFKRKGNKWFKVIPDVILGVAVRRLRGNALDVTFDILPFACYDPKSGAPGEGFQPDTVYEKTYREEFLQTFVELNGTRFLPDGIELPNFLYSVDSTAKALQDEQKRAVILKYWGDVFDKTIAPYLFAVEDLYSAYREIGRFLGLKDSLSVRPNVGHGEAYYYPLHAPLFVKLGNPKAALPYFKQFLDARREEIGSDKDYIERIAKAAWQNGSKNSAFLWYWLIQNDDKDRLNKLVSLCENDAKAWLQKEKLI